MKDKADFDLFVHWGLSTVYTPLILEPVDILIFNM